MHRSRDRNSTLSVIRRFAGIALPWLLVAFAAAGCEGGGLEPAADAEGANDTAWHTSDDLDVRSADGAYACGYFPDTCPEGANCYVIDDGGELRRRCLEHDSGSEGDECDPGRLGQCGDGRRCYQGTCHRICDPNGAPQFGCDSGDASRDACVPIRTEDQSLPWGICQRKSDECTLWPNDSCPVRKNCYATSRGNRCLEYNPDARAGDPCEGSTDCNDAQVCVRRRDGSEGENVCRDKCDGAHPCERGTCEAISVLEFGACFPQADAG